MRSETIIKVDNIYHSYPDGTPALNGISLDIKRGEFVALVGKNGCGKSTLIKHLNGLLIPDKGVVTVNGMDTSLPSNLWTIRQMVGMVFQNPDTQFVRTTVEEDVAFGPENLALSSENIKKRTYKALSDTSMEEFRDREPKSLSGGQMQRAAIAGVMAMDPECIIFDEVTSMLDQGGRREILTYLNNIRSSGRTIIYVTHMLEEVLNADRIVLMNNNEIRYTGPPSEFFMQEGLEEMGIEVPDIIQLIRRLQQANIIEPEFHFTDINRLADRICRSLSGI